MNRSSLNFASVAVFIALGTIASTALAHGGGGGGGGGVHHGPTGGQQMAHINNVGNNQFNSVQHASFNKPISNNVQPFKINPTSPSGQFNSNKFFNGNSGLYKFNGNCYPYGCYNFCKPWWPPIVLGCGPCYGYGGYYGSYYPPVYSQTVVVPATTSLVVADAPLTNPTNTVAAVEKLPQVPAGSTLTLNGKDLGSDKGQAVLVIDKLALGTQIDQWTTDHATVTLPLLSISGPTKAEIVLVKTDGRIASSVKVELMPAPQQPNSESATGTVASVVR